MRIGMALVLTVHKNCDDYLLVEHAGQRVRIGVNDPPRGDRTRAALVLTADDDSGKAPDQSWRLLRKKVREREDGA